MKKNMIKCLGSITKFCNLALRKNINKIKNYKMEKLEKKLQDLQAALKIKTISVNEYSTMYHQTYQQIKKLKNEKHPI